MEEGKTAKIVRGALLLTIAGLLSKVLSATYRIPLQNLTGDLGFYIYQQIYPLIGMAMIFGLYGFPVAVSKLVAERTIEEKENSFRVVYGPLFLIVFSMSAIFSVLLYILAPQISNWMKAPQLVGAFQLAAGLFILLPFIAVIRGAFQGKGEMAQTAYSQITEQAIRVTIIIIAAYMVYIGKLDVEAIGNAGVIASFVGTGIVTFIWLVYVLMRKRTTIHIIQTKETVPWKYYLKICFSLGVVAALSHMILILMQLVDVFTIVPGLMKSHLSPLKAMEWKGVFDRGQPLIQFGVVFGSSFALALVPSVVQHHKTRTTAIREALLFSFYIAGAATVGLIVLMPEVNQLLFLDTAGTGSLQILTISILLSAIGITACSILQNMGDVWIVAGWILTAFIIKWVLNMLLVPLFHIDGSALATVISLVVLVMGVLSLLQKRLPALQLGRHIRWSVCFFANMSMITFLLVIKYTVFIHMSFSRLGLLFYVLGTILVGAAIYMMILLRYQVLSEKQLQALPLSGVMQLLNKRFERKERDEHDL